MMVVKQTSKCWESCAQTGIFVHSEEMTKFIQGVQLPLDSKSQTWDYHHKKKK